ncbi:DUF5615 family PIN-like protein [Brevundimonas faecalis]|uniref:DUF5615 family PIN-like protein n=1 Tax=Brevundimonas faecalis TaxID=947378 RepID=UPI0036139BAA
MDAQLPPALAEWLRSQGHDAVHAISFVGVDASDEAIWDAAKAESRIIVTKDRDFAVWVSARRNGPQVVWIRLGNATTRSLIAWLTLRWLSIQDRLAEGAHLIEVRA